MAALTGSSRRPQGYLAATVGGVLGTLLIGGAGIGIGLGLMELYWDPGAGLGNLGLLVFPLGLGALGIVVGMSGGTRAALRRSGHGAPGTTAWLTVPITIAAFLAVPAWGIGLLVLPAVPAAARWLALHARPRNGDGSALVVSARP